MGKTMRKTGILLAVICMIMAGLAIGGKRAEASSKGFMYTERGDGTLKITGYYGKKKNVTVPAKIKGKKVKEIGTYTFAKAWAGRMPQRNLCPPLLYATKRAKPFAMPESVWSAVAIR